MLPKESKGALVMVDVTNARLGEKDKGKGKGNRKAEKKPTISHLQVHKKIPFNIDFRISKLWCADFFQSMSNVQAKLANIFLFTTLLHS